MPEPFVLSKDGNQWCATRQDFVNLQESLAGFGDEPHDAMIDLLQQELRAVQAGQKEMVEEWRTLHDLHMKDYDAVAQRRRIAVKA